MFEEAVLENVLWFFAARTGRRHADGQIPNLNSVFRRRFQFDVPIQHRAVGGKSLRQLKGRVARCVDVSQPAVSWRPGELRLAGSHVLPVGPATSVSNYQAQSLARSQDLRAERIIGIRQPGHTASVIADPKVALLDLVCGCPRRARRKASDQK